ncbi:MAG: hypothetical protein WBV60_19870 [Terriglobales bacterium]
MSGYMAKKYGVKPEDFNGLTEELLEALLDEGQWCELDSKDFEGLTEQGLNQAIHALGISLQKSTLYSADTLSYDLNPLNMVELDVHIQDVFLMAKRAADVYKLIGTAQSELEWTKEAAAGK